MSRAQRWAALVFALAGIVACDRATSPGRPAVPVPSPRLGDFLIAAENFRIPDSVKVGDTVHVTFDVGDGRDPCSFVGNVTLWFKNVFYVAPWGVNNPGDVCRTPTFGLFEPFTIYRYHSKAFDAYPDSLFDAVVYRVIICRPDGSYRRKDVVIVLPRRTRPVHIDNSDSTKQRDAAICQGQARLAAG